MDKYDKKLEVLRALSRLALTKSYHEISLKDIASQVGISPTSIYTYFESKEEIIENYMEEALKILANILMAAANKRMVLSNRIRQIIYLLYSLNIDEILLAFHRLLRELEFINEDLAKQYHKHLIDTLKDYLSDVPQHFDPSVTALSIVGGSEFLHIFRTIFGVPGNAAVDIEVLGDLILKGMGMCHRYTIDLSLKPLAEPPELRSIKNISSYVKIQDISPYKAKILEAALNVLAYKNFREAKVYEIMDKAGYSIGMFYRVYESKEDLLKDIVTIISKIVRRYLTLCTSGIDHPIAREILGTECFLTFVEKNSEIYRIIRESEFISIELAREYYVSFMERYKRRLEDDVRRNLVKTLSTEALTIVLMGINHSAGKIGMLYKLIDKESIVKGFAQIYSSGLLCTE